MGGWRSCGRVLGGIRGRFAIPGRRRRTRMRGQSRGGVESSRRITAGVNCPPAVRGTARARGEGSKGASRQDDGRAITDIGSSR
jgi:hypothetical protein